MYDREERLNDDRGCQCAANNGARCAHPVMGVIWSSIDDTPTLACAGHYFNGAYDTETTGRERGIDRGDAPGWLRKLANANPVPDYPAAE